MQFKNAMFMLLCLVTSAPSFASKPPQPTSEVQAVTNFQDSAKRFLPGSWRFEYRNDEPAFEMTGTSTYHQNGTADYQAELVIQGQRIPFILSADWRVEGNKMVTVVTASSRPDVVPVGQRSVDTIHQLTADVFHYTDDEEHISIKEHRLGS